MSIEQEPAPATIATINEHMYPEQATTWAERILQRENAVPITVWEHQPGTAGRTWHGLAGASHTVVLHQSDTGWTLRSRT